MMLLEKLDGRHQGNLWFTHRSWFPKRDTKAFLDVREWCWNTFGPSCELGLYSESKQANWAWRVDEERSYSVNYYIYLTEDARALFALKWI